MNDEDMRREDLSALADIADENELKFGLRQEGVLYSTRALFAKVDQAIGAALAGFVLTFINFPVKAQVGEVPAQVIWDLALWDGVLAGIPGFIAVFFYARYKITRATYEETKAALAARRAAGLAPQAMAASAAMLARVSWRTRNCCPHQSAAPIMKARVPVPPARPVVSVSKNSRLRGSTDSP